MNEIVSALFGAWRLALRDVQGLGYFEHSIEAFWRSFAAFLIAAPFYLMFVTAEWRLIGEAGATVSGDLTSYATTELIAYAVSWAAFPLAMVFASRALGVSAQYVSYIIVYNWSSVLIAVLMAPPYLLYSLGMAGPGGTALMALATLIVAIWYRWQIALVALRTQPMTATAVVALDLILSFAIELTADTFHRGGM